MNIIQRIIFKATVLTTYHYTKKQLEVALKDLSSEKPTYHHFIFEVSWGNVLGMN